MSRRWALPLALAAMAVAPSSAAAATFTVTNTANDGPGSLRQALADANGNGNPAAQDVISIQATGTVNLTSGLQANQPVAIQGPGARQFILRGQPGFTVLGFFTPGEVAASGMTITGGYNGVSQGNGTLKLSGMAITGNGRTGGVGGDSGGGISAGGGLGLQVSDSTIAGNFVESSGFVSGGGIIFSSGGNHSIVNSTIVGNRVSSSGANPTSGGGIAVTNGGEVEIRNSTFAGNTAATEGSSISAGFNAKVELLSTIVAEPLGGASLCFADTPNGASIVSQGFNLARDGSCFLGAKGDKPGTDPLLGPLQDNGGHTDTRAPSSESAAIDAGTGPGLTADQRGFLRPVDQTTLPNADSGADVGAVELPLFCRGQVPTILGTDGPETLTGTPGGDVIQALAGRDRVNASDGADIVCGGLGKDRLGGGKGNDVLAGEQGRDKLIGGAGKDRLLGGAAKDSCTGAGGKDKGSGCEKTRSVP